MEWFKGKFPGPPQKKHAWENLWFPVDFPNKTNPLNLRVGGYEVFDHSYDAVVIGAGGAGTSGVAAGALFDGFGETHHGPKMNGDLTWLVVWNMFIFVFHILGIIIPSDIFFRGAAKNHQPGTGITLD